MLVLRRYVKQKIRIGDDIVLTVRRVAGGQVKIGIEAPKDVTVLRQELEKTETPGEPVGPLPAVTGPAVTEPAVTEEGR